MGATGNAVRRPQTDGHQKGCDEAEHRSSDQRRDSTSFNGSNNGGDEDQDGAHTVVKELRQGAVDAWCPGANSENVDKEEDEQCHQEPQRHHLEKLERCPTGPATSTVYT